MTDTYPERSVWRDMHRRCYNSKNKQFKNYGERGITICERWHSFENFFEDMGPRPKDGTLGRKNNSKGYYKSNCLWATRYYQARNRRTNTFITINDQTLCLTDWCKIYKINTQTVYARVTRCGWDYFKALTNPLDNRGRRNYEHA